MPTISRVFRTPAVGAADSPDFLNAAVLCRTELEPLELRERVLREVERELGRRRSSDRFSPRTIDPDLIFFFRKPITELSHAVVVFDEMLIDGPCC